MLSLRNKAKQNHHYLLGEWVLSILICLLCGALMLTMLIDPIIVYLLFPVIIVPIIFACHLIFLSFKFNGALSLRSFFNNFKLYFRNPYYSSFNLISSFFRSLVVYLITFAFMAFLAVFITKNVYPAQFDTLVEVVNKIIMDSTLIYENELSDLFAECIDAYNLYTYLVSVPSLLVQWGFFIYYISKSSISIYFRMVIENVPSTFVKRMVNKAFYKNAKLVKDYFALNFPLYVIYGVVSIAGFILGLFFYQDIGVLAFIMASFFILFIVFMPFYITNMETLSREYEPMFKQAFFDVSKEVFSRLEEDPGLDPEQKEELEKPLRMMKITSKMMNKRKKQQVLLYN